MRDAPHTLPPSSGAAGRTISWLEYTHRRWSRDPRRRLARPVRCHDEPHNMLAVVRDLTSSLAWGLGPSAPALPRGVVDEPIGTGVQARWRRCRWAAAVVRREGHVGAGAFGGPDGEPSAGLEARGSRRYLCKRITFEDGLPPTRRAPFAGDQQFSSPSFPLPVARSTLCA